MTIYFNTLKRYALKRMCLDKIYKMRIMDRGTNGGYYGKDEKQR